MIYSDLVPDPGVLFQLADTGFPSNLNSDDFVIGPTEIVGPTGSDSTISLPAFLPADRSGASLKHIRRKTPRLWGEASTTAALRRPGIGVADGTASCS
jgi:hypothetical protein